jgi:uncharacterized membrane protein (TIGR02234 family)
MTLALALVLCGAALALFAAGRTWVSAEWAVPDFPAVHVAVSGGEAAPLVRAGGLVALAGVVAVLATRRLSRRIIGGIVAAAGAGMVVAAPMFWSQVATIADNALVTAAGDPTLTVHASDRATSGWPVAAGLAGVVVLVGGLLVTVHGGRWPAMGSRYDAPATAPIRSAAEPQPPAGSPARSAREPGDAWAALDRGEDPTAGG